MVYNQTAVLFVLYTTVNLLITTACIYKRYRHYWDFHDIPLLEFNLSINTFRLFYNFMGLSKCHQEKKKPVEIHAHRLLLYVALKHFQWSARLVKHISTVHLSFTRRKGKKKMKNCEHSLIIPAHRLQNWGHSLIIRSYCFLPPLLVSLPGINAPQYPTYRFVVIDKGGDWGIFKFTEVSNIILENNDIYLLRKSCKWHLVVPN